MKPRVDYNPDPDVDNVAAIAVGIAEKIREQDPRRLFDELTDLCRRHTAKAAQLIMTFAAWFDPEVPVQTLWNRVGDITTDRTAKASAA